MGAAAVTTDREARGAPGDVMVRVVRSRPGDYRTAPSRHVAEVIDGARPRRGARRGSCIVSWGAACAMGVALLLGLGTWVALVVVWLSELQLD